jgi:parallel beta-helix repeat protein
MKPLNTFLKILLLVNISLFMYACGGGKNETTKTAEQFVNAVSIKKYGASGDGKQDDTQAFKDAFAQETSLLIPAGRYRISQPLLIPETLQVLTGTGTVIGTSPNGILKTDVTSKGIKKLTINGITFQYQPTSDTNIGAIYFNDSDIKNLTIQNSHFTAPSNAKWGNAITLVGKKGHRVDNIKIINNSFSNITRAAIEILVRGKDKTKSTDFPDWPAVYFDKKIVSKLSITGNTFTHQRGTYYSTNREIFNPAISLSGAVNGTLIENNKIDGFYWGVELDGSTKTKVSNNIISTKHSSISISHGSDTEANSTLIDGNTLTSVQKNNIYVINAHEARSITISNNTITGLVYLRQTDNFILNNNKLYSKLYTNLVIEDASNTKVTKNYLENTDPTSNGSVSGKGHSDHSNKVTGNTIYVKGNRHLTNLSGTSIMFENNTRRTTPK